MSIDKEKLKDSGGRPLTQSLFLEFGYNTDFAVYTWTDEDKEYKGKIYPSLKKLFLEEEDPTEYRFAKKHLLGWKHWQRLNDNKALRIHFDEWREELEVYIRSQGLRSVIDQSEGNFQAAKYLAEKGWEKNRVGRPSKQDAERERRINDGMQDFLGDVARLSDYT